MTYLSQYLSIINQIYGTEITNSMDTLSRQGGGYYIDPFPISCSAKGNMDLNTQEKLQQIYGTVNE